MKYELGTRIKYFRELNGISQKEFASKIGFTNSRISNWEQGISRPDADILPLICKVLSITADELLGLDFSSGNTHSITSLTPDERHLVEDYRGLSEQGQEYIRQTMYMARQNFKKASASDDSAV